MENTPSLEPVWTAEEDKRIFDTFTAPTKTLTSHSAELALELNRTAAAISTRWYKNLSPNRGKGKPRAKRMPANLLSDSKSNKDKPAKANPPLTVGQALMDQVLNAEITSTRMELHPDRMVIWF